MTSDFLKDHTLHSTPTKQRRVRWAPDCRVRGSAAEDVLHPRGGGGGGQEYQEGKGCKKGRCIHGMDVLRSEGHQIYGQRLNKVSLSPFDSKRWIAENGMDTLAYRNREAWRE